MYEKVVNTKNLPYKEWLLYRRQGIGGSDAGAVCGLNPYVSPIAVYRDKTEPEPDIYDNEPMRQGRDLEQYVAERFEEETGKKVRRTNFLYRSVEHPFMQANVDRLIVGEDAGLECKTASAYNIDKWKDGAIPEHYEIQCQHYMAVMGSSAWYIAVVIMGVAFKWRKIVRDEGLIRDLITIEADFWHGNVVPRLLPDPDGSLIYDDVLERYFHVAKKNATIPLVGFNDKLRRRAEVIKLQDRLEEEKRQIDQELKLFIGDNERAYNDSFKVSWSNVSSDRLDIQRIKEEEPELYKRYLKTSVSRRFLVKEIAG